MRACLRCSGPVEATFRFCPWCAAPQRLKLVEFFRPHPAIEGDRAKALRLSRYLDGAAEDRHVRFSIWTEAAGIAEAEAAISLEETEADRLARFVAVDDAPTGVTRRLRALVPKK